MKFIILTLSTAAVVLGAPRHPLAPRAEVVEDTPEKFMDSAFVEPQKRSVIEDYDSMIYGDYADYRLDTDTGLKRDEKIDIYDESDLIDTSGSRRQERLKRSFNDIGPVALLDQVKDVAEAVLEDKNILTKYD